MKPLKYIGLTILLTNCWIANSQIEISEEKSEKQKPDKPKANVDGSTEVFVITNWSSTTRKLVENDGLFGDPLGTRADEGSLNTWSFGLGIRNKITDYISWEGGITYLRNGESYLFEEADTMHRYETTYSYISMPIKALFTYGDQVKILAGGGVIPQMFVNYKQFREWKDSKNTETDEEFKTKSGFNSFAVSAVANIGVQINFGKRTSVLFMPEYRIQLSSSYEKTDSYKHYARALGFNMGLTFQL